MRMEEIMVLECTACGEPMSDHAADCPAGELARLWESTPRGRCPVCRKGDVLPNAGDYFECRACRVQFTRGWIAAGENPDLLETKTLDLAGEADLVMVKVMKTPGSGDFPVLARTRRLEAKVKAARAGRKAAKREYDRVLAREMAKIAKDKEGKEPAP